jgi:hypothetical protein
MKASKIDPYFLFTHEDESYKDEKIKGSDVRFPSHNDTQCSEVTTYHISELNVK